MKTAMEELIDELRKTRDDGEHEYRTAYNLAIAIANEFLEKEKEQIMNANIEGTEHVYRERTVFGLDPRPYTKKRAKEYYNQTYNQNQ